MLTRYSFFLVSRVANRAITDAVMGTEILHYLSVLSFYVAYAIQSVNMLNFSFKNSKFTPFYCFLSLFLSTCNFASETPVQTLVTRRPFCLRRFKKLCLCTASLVLSTRLAVHKQSFLNHLRQNSRRVTKVCW